jgi:hypothetical protein
MKTGLTFTDNITKDLKEMTKRAHAVSSYLNRNLFKQYQRAQQIRFDTYNASETGEWVPLTPKYLKQKLKKARKLGWPGGGGDIMRASGALYQAAIGKENYLKMVTDRSFTVSIDLGAIPYAIYPGTERPYMTFSEETESFWMFGITEFITQGRQVTV